VRHKLRIVCDFWHIPHLVSAPMNLRSENCDRAALAS